MTTIAGGGTEPHGIFKVGNAVFGRFVLEIHGQNSSA